MGYDKKHFDPPPAVSRPDEPEAAYLADPEGRIVLAVNIALAARRPLLVRGPTGCGKSSLARHVADVKGWRWEQAVLTSRTEARDLKWTFDAVARLNDAQAQSVRPPACYVRPGVLWRAFAPADAALYPRAVDDKGAVIEAKADAAEKPQPVVVLLDEIDKADPELPNDLLVPIETGDFPVHDLPGHTVRRHPEQQVLVVITTNRTRALPAAFVRRCVVLDLEPPDADRLAAVGRLRFPEVDSELLGTIADTVIACGEDLERPPSIAEYLDAVQSCVELGLSPDGPEWAAVLDLTIAKREPDDDLHRGSR